MQLTEAVDHQKDRKMTLRGYAITVCGLCDYPTYDKAGSTVFEHLNKKYLNACTYIWRSNAGLRT